MSDILSEATSWLHSTRAEYMTKTVTYSRGAASVEVAATVGRTVFRTVEDYGVEVREVSRDYLITAADLILAEVVVRPVAGDQIEEVGGETTYTYEVMSFAGEPEWRWSDPHYDTLRVHTKLVNEE